MKTGVINVRALLSVLGLPGVKECFGSVTCVESVAVNRAAGSATVRYDDMRPKVANIESALRRGAEESASTAASTLSEAHAANDAHAGLPFLRGFIEEVTTRRPGMIVAVNARLLRLNKHAGE